MPQPTLERFSAIRCEEAVENLQGFHDVGRAELADGAPSAFEPARRLSDRSLDRRRGGEVSIVDVVADPQALRARVHNWCAHHRHRHAQVGDAAREWSGGVGDGDMTQQCLLRPAQAQLSRGRLQRLHAAAVRRDANAAADISAQS